MTNPELLDHKFCAVARNHPENLAVVSKQSCISYQVLDRYSDQIASTIAAANIHSTGRILTYLPSGIDFINAILGVLKAGFAYAPVDINDPPSRTRDLIKNLAPDLIITTPSLEPKLELPQVPLLILDETQGAIFHNLPDCKGPAPEVRPHPPLNSLAYIIYTSGSTGDPKGIGIPHGAVINLMDAFNLEKRIGPKDKCALWSNLNFDVSTYEIWSALLTGACLYIPEDSVRFAPLAFMDWLTTHGITSAYIPPFMISEMAVAPKLPHTLKRMLTGVNPIPEQLLRDIKAKIPGLCLLNGYGPAEATVCATLYSVPESSVSDLSSGQRITPIGKPVQNLEIQLLDAKGHQVKQGENGEICIRGIQVATGYLGDPLLSDQKFIPPFTSNIGSTATGNTTDLMYRTGDLGFWLPDGNLMFAGRINFQIKHHGIRIEPGEIERHITAFPGISQAAVVLKEGPSDKKILTAYFDGTPDKKALFDFLKSKLPRTMLPADFIRLSALPQTPQGKIDRRALINLKKEKKEGRKAPLDKESSPQDRQILAMEREVGAIWEQVLSLSPITRDDNFLFLGGDSILGVKIISRVNQLFDTHLLVNVLFDDPELKNFARRIPLKRVSNPRVPNPMMPGPSDPIENKPLPRGMLPLLPDQQLIWLFEQLNPGTCVYHIPLVYEVFGNLDMGQLKTALTLIQAHHPALNLVFSLDEDQVFQTQKKTPLEFSMDSESTLSHPKMPLKELPAKKNRWLEKQVALPFDLEQGPLFRTAVLKEDTNSFLVCFTFHHLIFDGWSAALFIRELNQVYGRLVRSEEMVIPPPNMTYSRHVLSTVRKAIPLWQEAKPFFSTYLMGLPMGLPKNSSSGSGEFEAATWPIKIETAHYGRIKEIAREHHTSAFAVLLSFFQLLLFSHTNQNDQVTGLAYANRNRVETEPVIGFLLNTLVARNHVRIDMGFSQFLAQVKKNLETLFEFGQIPFYQISQYCQELGHDRDPDHNKDIFQSLFLMQTMELPLLDLLETQSEYLHFKTNEANTDITLELYEKDSGAMGWFKYRTKAFSSKEIGQMEIKFQQIIKSVIELPESTIDSIIGMNSFPISPMQHGMLMESLRAPQGAGCYVEQILFDMNQDIDIDRFTLAWEKIIRHHDIMRLGFVWKGLDYPEQYIAPATPLKIEYNDWSGVSESEKKEYLDMFLKADRRLGFPLYKPPTFRVALFKTGARRHTCTWSFHHCIADGRSMTFILRDFFLAYQNPAVALSPAGSFKHYILWLNRQQQTEAKKFWTQYLEGFDTPMVFPFRAQKNELINSRRQQHAMSLATGLHKTMLSPITARNIKSLCEKHEITLNSFLMGAWAVLLSYYTGKTDILFGATVSVRNFEQNQSDKTGMYINTLPVRIHVHPEQTLLSFISGMRKKWRGIREHQHMSLTDIHSLSPIKGNIPLSEIYFSYDYQSLDAAMDPYKERISCSKLTLFERTPAAIFLAVQGVDDLMISIEYDQRKFNAKTTRQILDHFAVFLKSASENPQARLMELPVLTEGERTKIAEKLNTRQRHLKPRSCIHHLFEIQASINRTAPAVTDGEKTYNYQQLNLFANQIAHFLITRNAGPEKKVLLLLEQTIDLIAILLGVLKSGCGYIPMHHSYPDERIQYILKDAAPDFIITTRENLGKLGTTDATMILMDQDLDEIKTMESSNPVTDVGPDNMAYIIYTSGSTGLPKGVEIEHSSLVSFTKSAADTYDFQSSDRVLQFASISFDTSAEEIYPTLFSGATLVMKPQTVVQTPAVFFDFCRHHQLTVIDLPTAYWHMIADQIDTLTLPEHLRLVIIGGEEANPENVRKWQAHISSIRLLNTYGPTETTVAATYADLSQLPMKTGRVPIGIPFSNVNLCILNHFKQPTPPGITGELHIGGPQTARGYLNRPEQTRNAFVSIESLQNKERFFKTGDQAMMLPTGQIIFLGRIDRQVKIRGFRVEPGEIEKTALTHKRISACAIALSKDIDDNIKLTAFIVPAEGKPDNFNYQEVKTWLKSKLPEYMVPSNMVGVPALPHTASGKIDYKTLEKSIPDTLKDESDSRSDTHFSPDTCPDIGEGNFMDEYEIKLRDIWEKILKNCAVKATDNFFEIGGSSLTAIRLVTAIEKNIHISIPILVVFKFPVLGELAQVLREKDANFHFTNIKTIRKEGTKAPIFFIAGTKENTQAYLDQDLNGHPFYTVTVFAHKTVNNRIIPMDLWEIARKNVIEIIHAKPTGPYIIVGFCRYSIVAFEIATQLATLGKKVDKLIFIDEFWHKKQMLSSDSPDSPGENALKIPPHGTLQTLKKIIPNAQEKLVRLFLDLEGKREKLYRALGKSIPETLQARLMESSFWKAYESYMPLPYTGDAILLDTKLWKENNDPKLRSYLRGELNRIQVDAPHKDWFKPAQIHHILAAIEDNPHLPDRYPL
jgi:amino acid adenylation domain-containing protein